MLLKENMTIVSQVEIAPRIYEMVLRGDLVEQMTIGQFLHIRVPDARKRRKRHLFTALRELEQRFLVSYLLVIA